MLLILEFVVYFALFSPGLRELLGYSSEPLPRFFYTIKLEKTENGCPTGKATVCTLLFWYLEISGPMGNRLVKNVG